MEARPDGVAVAVPQSVVVDVLVEFGGVAECAVRVRIGGGLRPILRLPCGEDRSRIGVGRQSSEKHREAHQNAGPSKNRHSDAGSHGEPPLRRVTALMMSLIAASHDAIIHIVDYSI